MRFAIGLPGSVVVIVFFADAADAAVIEIDGPQDSLAGAPTINHCTLRKAIINANDNAATYPQCPAGSGIDEIRIPGFTITFALTGINEESKSAMQSLIARAEAAAASCQVAGLPPSGFVPVGDGPVAGPKQ
jgi:hypothetical protein